MIVAAINLGRPFIMHTPRAIREEIRPPDGYDSVIGVGHYGTAGNALPYTTEYIVYESNRIVPRFAITYKHKDCCMCSRCS